MPRAKKNTPAQPPLAAPLPVPAPVFEPPRMVRYIAGEGDDAEDWQAERFDLLAVEFDIHVRSVAEAGAALAKFHAVASECPRQWQLARRLFGVAPLIQSPDTHPDDMEVWSRERLAADGYEVDAELAALRTIWRDHLNREEQSKMAETVSTKLSGAAPSEGDLPLDDRLLETFQFSERIFKIKVWDPTAGTDGAGAEVPRSDAENRVERDWFAGRVQDWQKMLKDPMGAPVARSALMNDLYLRRMEYEMAVSPSNRREKLMEQQQRLTRDYNTSIEKLQEMFPDIAVAGRIAYRATISDITVGHRDYYAHGDRRLVDKLFTAAEIELQLRSSLQLPAQHRFSLGLAVVENQHGMYDPEFRSQFKPRVLKMIDAMTRAAREAVRELQNEPVVDLERGTAPDEPDQFEDFNDEQCREPLKDGKTCGRWHPNGKACPNAKNHQGGPIPAAPDETRT
jgi:hypothetical protein